MDSFFDWWFQLWPDWLIRWYIPVWAVGASFVGAFTILFMSFIAIRHFAFGHKIQDQDTGKPLSAMQALRDFLLFGGVGAVFLVIGILLLRWEPG